MNPNPMAPANDHYERPFFKAPMKYMRAGRGASRYSDEKLLTQRQSPHPTVGGQRQG
ncbi:MAG: hypothetical protein ABGZ35_17040 [Planctomycetaceae bacterium]|jgi:hypothetical protein